MLSFPYFSERYFSAYYFGALGVQIPSGGTSPSDLSDSYLLGTIDAAFGNLIDLVDSIGSFSSVSLGSPSDLPRYGSSGSPYVIVKPQGWVDEDEVDPEMIVRTVSFEISVYVSEVDETSRYEQLQGLCSAITTVIRGSDLGSGCLPFLTRVTQVKFPRDSVYPTNVGLLIGSFSLLVDSSAKSPSFFSAS